MTHEDQRQGLKLIYTLDLTLAYGMKETCMNE